MIILQRIIFFIRVKNGGKPLSRSFQICFFFSRLNYKLRMQKSELSARAYVPYLAIELVDFALEIFLFFFVRLFCFVLFFSRKRH